MPQIATIQRRQQRLDRLQSDLEHRQLVEANPKDDLDAKLVEPYAVGKTQNHRIHIPTYVGERRGDLAVAVRRMRRPNAQS